MIRAQLGTTLKLQSMKSLRALTVCTLLSAAIATPCFADHALRVPLAGHGTLVLQVPDSWTEHVVRPAADLPPTVTLSPVKGQAFQVLLTPIWSMAGKRTGPTAQEVRAIVQSSLAQVRDQAVEKEIPLQELAGPKWFGNYFNATDKAPKPGEYANMTQGMLSTGELGVTFTILSNGDRNAVANPALGMLQSMQRE